MKLLCKAFKTCYINMSPVFKAILYLGIGLFLTQQLLCGALNLYFISEGYKNISLKELADIYYSSSYSILAIAALISVFGDYVLFGRSESD